MANPTVQEIDFSRLLPILNTAQIRQKNPALYQILEQLILNTGNLQSALVTQVINIIPSGGGGGGIGNVTGPGASTDKAIARYLGITGKVIQNSTPIVDDDGRISILTDPTSAQDATTKNYVDTADAVLNALIVALAALDYLTWDDESASLPNSRRLIAGSNITFDDTVANQRTISSSGGGGGTDFVVLSDGNTPTPSPVNDGDGNFIYVPYTP